MKETIIKWHNVETDGLPEKSGNYLVRTDIGEFRNLPYSVWHKEFNTYDWYSDEYVDETGIGIGADWWAELPDLDEEKENE